MSDEEKVVNWLEENYKGIILGLIIGISILYGYKTYVSNQNSHQLEISRLYDLAIESYTNGDPSSILSFSKRYMDSDPSNIYTQLASFYSAKIMYEKNNNIDAISYLTHIIENSNDKEIKELAIHRKAKVLVELNKIDDALKIIDFNTQNYQLIELRSDIYVIQEKYLLAEKGYKQVLSYELTPNERKNINAKLNTLK